MTMARPSQRMVNHSEGAFPSSGCSSIVWATVERKDRAVCSG